jgi:hypothetical protein
MSFSSESTSVARALSFPPKQQVDSDDFAILRNALRKGITVKTRYNDIGYNDILT